MLIEFTMSKVTMVICGSLVVAMLIIGFGSVNTCLEEEVLMNRMRGIAEAVEGMAHLVPGSSYLVDPHSVLVPPNELHVGTDYLRLVSGERTITVTLSHPLVLMNYEGEPVEEIVMKMDDTLVLFRTEAGILARQEKVSTSFDSVLAKSAHSSKVL